MLDFRTRGFHHVTLVSTDARRTLAFYRDLLGLRFVKRTVNFDDPSAYHLYLGDEEGRPGTVVTFFEWPRADPGKWGIGGVHHVALGVATAAAQLKWKRRLEDAGVQVNGPIDRGYFTSLYFSDPDGQILEIATKGPGYTFDEAPGSLGNELKVPDPARLPGGRDDDAARLATHPEPVPEVSDDMRLDGIHHVSAITNDLARAGDFYGAALGLDLVKRTFNQDDGKTKHYFWAACEGDEVLPRSSLTLFDWSGSTYPSRPGAGQTHHIAFRVENDEQQAAWREHLLSLGIGVSPVRDRTYFRSIYFRAPDGLLVELATDGPGFAADESMDQLGEGLKLPEWLEPRRPSIEQVLAPLP